MITLPGFLNFVGIYTLIGTIISFYLLNEPKDAEQPDISAIELIKLVPKIVFHKETRWEILMTPIFETVYSFVERYYIIRIQDMGFSKEEISMWDSSTFFIDLGVMFLLGRLSISEKYWDYYRVSNTVCYLTVTFVLIELTFLDICDDYVATFCSDD